jgi:hypothetical protein
MSFGLAPSMWNGKINSPKGNSYRKSRVISLPIPIGVKIWSE